MKHFKDFAKEQNLDGEKVKLDSVLDKEITILAYQLTGSKYSGNGKMCLKLQFEMDGQRYIFFTGSTVLARQVEDYKNEMPFIATVRKIDKYYTFT